MADVYTMYNGKLDPIYGDLLDVNAGGESNLSDALWTNSSESVVGNCSRGGGVISATACNVDVTEMTTNDAAWILTATFIIFTMQSGFGLLEAGCVSLKNETNIMVKNVVDVVLGGLTYWLFGYGLSYGQSEWTNPIFGWGNFAFNPVNDDGAAYTTFFFQLSFATTATTVVSGAIAERFRFSAYMLFSSLNTVIYCLPASWIWAPTGFLYKLGAVDIAGACCVHLCGGTSALVACWMLGPRLGRYERADSFHMGSPTTALLGMFMLWWGWLGFNCGSTLGIDNYKWKYAAKTAVVTMQGSIGGGLVGLIFSRIKGPPIEIADIVNSVLGSLVSVTGGCALFSPIEALAVGAFGGFLASIMTLPLGRMHIDDPAGAVPVHGVCGLWALIAIGLLAENDKALDITNGRSGLFRGGGFGLLGVEMLAGLCTMVWSASITFLLLKAINRWVVAIRMDEWEELMGADFAEHGIRRQGDNVERVMSAFGIQRHVFDEQQKNLTARNAQYAAIVKKLKSIDPSKKSKIVEAVISVKKRMSMQMTVVNPANRRTKVIPMAEQRTQPPQSKYKDQLQAH